MGGMERIKLAINKARSSADQLQAAQPESQVHAASPVSKAVSVPEARLLDGGLKGKARIKPINAWWPTLLLFALVSVGTAWFLMGFDAGTYPAYPEETQSASSTPAPQGAIVSPPQPAGLAPPDATDRSMLVGGIHSMPVGPAEPATTWGPQEAQITAAVEAWRSAWAARDMANYLDAYSRAFVPSGGMSRQEWVANRYRNVAGRPSIDVVIRNVKIESLAQDRAQVSFLQDYVSGAFRELDQLKTLDLVHEDKDRWRIVRETLGSTAPSR